MNKLIRPVPQVVYTAAQIYRELHLMDSPALVVRHGELEGTMQDSHIADIEHVLANPSFANSKWRYQRTTHEWIPIFTYVPEEGKPVTEFLDLEECTEYDDTKCWWVTPVGFPAKRWTPSDSGNY